MKRKTPREIAQQIVDSADYDVRPGKIHRGLSQVDLVRRIARAIAQERKLFADVRSRDSRQPGRPDQIKASK